MRTALFKLLLVAAVITVTIANVKGYNDKHEKLISADLKVNFSNRIRQIVTMDSPKSHFFLKLLFPIIYPISGYPKHKQAKCKYYYYYVYEKSAPRLKSIDEAVEMSKLP